MNKYKMLLWSLGAVLTLGFLSGHASAVVIFEDNFNRSDSNSVGNGWSEDERHANDVAIRDNYLRLRDETEGYADAAAWQFESTVGYSDIFIDFQWAASANTESNDTLYLAFLPNGNTSGRTDIWSTALGGSGFSTTVSIGAIAGADNLSTFGFMFYTDVSTSREFAAIDNVVVRGTAASVPEPGSLALLGLGLAGLGLSRRKAS